MLFHNPSSRVSSKAEENGSLPVILFGRFMREDRSEHPCRVRDITLREVRVQTDVSVEEDERIIAYVDDIGRLEGRVRELREGGFILKLQMGVHALSRLQQKLEWVQRKARGEGIEKRRYERFRPRETRSQVTLEDGRRYPCEVLDISVSGASVKCPVLPAIGTVVTVGKTKGRVVRHHGEGFAVEFTRLLSEEALRAQID